MNKINKNNKHAQEEMVGFAMIIIIVAVIILILLGISINKPKTQGVESYEVESFIQAMLQQTTTCSTDYKVSYDSVDNLIIDCDSGQLCDGGQNTCSVLNSTLKDILNTSWPTGQDRPVKGYELDITSKNRIILNMRKGNLSSNYKGSTVDLSKKGITFSIGFKAYY